MLKLITAYTTSALLLLGLAAPVSAGVVGSVAKLLGAEAAAEVIVDQAAKAFKDEEKVYGAELEPQVRARRKAWLEQYVAAQGRIYPYTTTQGDVRIERLSIGPGLLMNTHVTMLDRDSRVRVMHPLDEDYLERMKKKRCSNSDMLAMFKAGMAVRDIFHSADGKPLAAVIYDAEVCAP